MLETSVHPRICERIRSGPLGRWVDDFVDVLAGREYATRTIRPACSSRRDLQRLAGSAAPRGDRHRRDAGRSVRQRVAPATVLDAPEQPAGGGGRRRHDRRRWGSSAAAEVEGVLRFP